VCNPDQRNRKNAVRGTKTDSTFHELERISVQTKSLVWAIFFSAVLMSAADTTPLNVKEGLWEMTVTHSISGMPAAPNLPPDALAKLPPEQRARIEAMVNGTPDVHKECVTREKLQKNAAFNANRGDCTRTVVNSTGRKLEVKFHCEDKQTISDGTLLIDAMGTDSVKATMHSAVNSNGRAMTMDFSITSKYLGADCGDVK
jgi:hypothetical protein